MTEELDSFISEKIDNALHHFSISEKVVLAKHIMAQAQSTVKTAAIHGILRSSDNLAALEKLVQTLGVDELLKLEDEKLANLVAYAVYHPMLDKASMPSPLSPKASFVDIIQAFSELEAAIIERVHIIHDNQQLKDTKIAKEYIAMGSELLTELSQRRKTSGTNLHKLRYTHNIVLEKIDLAFTHGVHAADSPARRTVMGDVIPGVAWRLSELAAVREALEILPQIRILNTPKLTTIERVQDLGRGVMGARYPDGTIRIADFAIDMPSIERIFPGYSSLTGVLVHELLHGIQLGAESGGVSQNETGELSIEAGERIIDFDEFVKISGWTPIAEDRWEPMYDGTAIKLDGEVYQLGVPVVHQGEAIIVTFSRGTVFTRKAFTGFSLDLYSSTNPWEDFAETATEYFLAPERLIQLAPEKFQYFEQEFGAFKDREDLKKMLEDSLKKFREKYGDKK
ncbi:MAG: hypothetical protein R3A13_04925 [Bdellovibrionota bacterium]